MGLLLSWQLREPTSAGGRFEQAGWTVVSRCWHRSPTWRPHGEVAEAFIIVHHRAEKWTAISSKHQSGDVRSETAHILTVQE